MRIGGWKEYQYVIFTLDEIVETGFDTYEEAELACLKKLIEIAKQLIADTSQRISDEIDKMVVEEMIKIAKNK